jgi:CRP-like cAMP-binding protein
MVELFDYPALATEPQGERALRREFTFLDNLPTTGWKQIIAHAQTVPFTAGQELVRIGERDEAFYILTAGTVAVMIAAGGGERVVATITEGSVFGEIAFFDGEPRSATIRAMSDGSALRITRDRFDNLSGWNPILARQILIDLGRLLAMRLRWTTQGAPPPTQPDRRT